MTWLKRRTPISNNRVHMCIKWILRSLCFYHIKGKMFALIIFILRVDVTFWSRVWLNIFYAISNGTNSIHNLQACKTFWGISFLFTCFDIGLIPPRPPFERTYHLSVVKKLALSHTIIIMQFLLPINHCHVKENQWFSFFIELMF